MVNVLTTELKREGLTTYEHILLEGRVEGLAQGIALIFDISTKKAVEVFAFLQQNPTAKDLQTAEDFEVPLEFVQKIRQAIEYLRAMPLN